MVSAPPHNRPEIFSFEHPFIAVPVTDILIAPAKKQSEKTG